MSSVCHLYVIRFSLVCTRTSFVCHSFVLVHHPYVTRMNSYDTRMSLVCIHMSFVCHSSVVLPWTRCMVLYPWSGVRKCWFSMLSNFKKCCLIDSPLTNKFHCVKEVNGQDNRMCLQDIKTSNIRFARDKT